MRFNLCFPQRKKAELIFLLRADGPPNLPPLQQLCDCFLAAQVNKCHAGKETVGRRRAAGHVTVKETHKNLT